MPIRRLAWLTALTMAAFAANSVLCRVALTTTRIDPGAFTLVRLAGGAAALALIVRARAGTRSGGGDWRSAVALFVYAAGFSFAYVRLTAGTGALLLFGAVQLTMIGYGLARGERVTPLGAAGSLIAVGGLVLLVAPGLTAPPPVAATLMALAGVAWGAYSIRGRASADPLSDTAGNFLRAAPLALILPALSDPAIDPAGAGYALVSGALASGAGYAVWYTVLPHFRSGQAAVVQLSVPVIAAAAGVALLGEPLTLRLAAASGVTLGGVWLALTGRIVRASTEDPSRRR